MALRCLLFTSDEEAAQLIRQALADLHIEGEYCPAAVGAVERVTNQSFQLVIVDWENQPEAGFLLQTARERKAAERPLTLAIVTDDSSVPQALQAGANSILRKPIQVNQVRDTLTTARDLLRTKFEPAAHLAQAAAASASPSPAALRTTTPLGGEKTLRAGEFLQSSAPAPGAQFITEPDAHSSPEAKAADVDPLEDLTPMAASVETKEEAPEASAPRSSEPRGLSWYLSARAGTLPPVTSPPIPSPTPAPARPELLGYDQIPVFNETTPPRTSASDDQRKVPEHALEHEKKSEAALFAYIDGESAESPKDNIAKPRPWLSKLVLAAALALIGGVAYLKVPQPLWKQNVHMFLGSVVHAGKGWLSPPPVTPPQAPAAHENFGRAGDEYKLPVLENIPDATTDPSQIRVLPVIDPTAKPQTGANGAQTPTDGATATTDPAQTSPVQVQENQPAQPAPTAADPPSAGMSQPPRSASNVPQSVPQSPRPDPFAAPATVSPAATLPTVSRPASTKPGAPQNPQGNPAPAPSTSGIPTSLKSQMASMTPEASGNKPAEAAMASIEPVDLPEATARGLLLEQPDLPYPQSAKGQQGKVVLAVLIGRDGTVQDAKFLQGSLAFARAAIDNVKKWRFKPYTMNGRAVSTQTLLTISFKPAS
jgi:protein TonB